jgi:hypothetical protein
MSNRSSYIFVRSRCFDTQQAIRIIHSKDTYTSFLGLEHHLSIEPRIFASSHFKIIVEAYLLYDVTSPHLCNIRGCISGNLQVQLIQQFGRNYSGSPAHHRSIALRGVRIGEASHPGASSMKQNKISMRSSDAAAEVCTFDLTRI